jgi:hypothetical protein
MTLLRELILAHQTANRSDLREALSDCGLKQGGPIWGLDFVQVDTEYYQPSLEGRAAIIVPLFGDGALLDLIACSLATRSCRTRLGICTVLGREWLDQAREHDTAARLLPDPIEWLRNGRRGAVIVDWRSAPYELADLPGISVSNDLLAKRIDNALRQPANIPPIFVRETPRVATA